MRKKLMTALTGVTLCLAFAANPNPIMAEEDSADIQPGVSLRQRTQPKNLKYIIGVEGFILRNNEALNNRLI